MLIYGLIWLLLQSVASLHIIPEEPWRTMFSYFRIPYNFPFFIAGYWLMQHSEWINSITQSKRIYSVCLFMLVPLYIVRDRFEVNIFPFTYIIIILMIILLISLASRYGHKLPCRHGIAYIGRHTIDIYLLHYFFIPKEMPWLRTLIAPTDVKDVNITLEFFFCLAIAIMVTTLALLTSKIVRESPCVAKLLLGIQTQKKQ